MNDLPLAISYLVVAQAFNNYYEIDFLLLWLNALGLVRYNKYLILFHFMILKPYLTLLIKTNMSSVHSLYSE